MIGTLMKLFGGPIIEKGFELIDELHTSDEEKLKAKTAMHAMVLEHTAAIEETVSKEIQAKASIMVAEMQSGDNFTRRARPLVVYVGLFSIVANYVFGPWMAVLAGIDVPAIELPEEFWWTFTGVTSVWMIGRSAEKRGSNDKVLQMIMGGPPPKA